MLTDTEPPACCSDFPVCPAGDLERPAVCNNNTPKHVRARVRPYDVRARVRPYGSLQPEALARRAGNLTTAGWIAAVLDGTAPLAVAPEAAYVARCHAKAVECAKVRGPSIVQRATRSGLRVRHDRFLPRGDAVKRAPLGAARMISFPSEW